jgi:type II secretion system protein C
VLVKKSDQSARKRVYETVESCGGAHRGRRPWLLISLGTFAVATLVFVQMSRVSVSGEEALEDKVYSAAADTFEPMAVSSRQSGLLEPAGVAKPLKLFAVKAGGDSRTGLAVLGAAEASSRTYVAGALLENGARLIEVHADRVVLVQSDRRHTLYLSRKGADAAPASRSTPELTIGGFEPPAPQLNASSVRVSDAMRLAPAFDGDQIVGFNVYSGTRPDLMDRWGLKSGDVLVALSGQLISSTEQMENAIEQLGEGESILVEVRREQERLAVTLDGSLLLAAVSEPTKLATP